MDAGSKVGSDEEAALFPTDTVPSEVAPSENCTVPVALMEAVLPAGAMEAMRRTFCPSVEGLGAAVTLVWLLARPA